MTELTLHTGFQGEQTVLHVQWYDHNNCRHQTDITIGILNQDKPRTLEIRVNGYLVYRIPTHGGMEKAAYDASRNGEAVSGIFELWHALGHQLHSVLELSSPREE